jgi:hypothetical protein
MRLKVSALDTPAEQAAEWDERGISATRAAACTKQVYTSADAGEHGRVSMVRQ